MKAHQTLDKAVDGYYRPRPLMNETKQIEFCGLYDKYTSRMFGDGKKKEENKRQLLRFDFYMKVRDIINQLTSEGWYIARQNGSHKMFKHNNKPDIRIVLPDHGNNKEPSIGDIRKKPDGNNILILKYEILSNV